MSVVRLFSQTENFIWLSDLSDAGLAYGTTIKLSHALEYVVIPMEDGEFVHFSKFFSMLRNYIYMCSKSTKE